MRPMPIMVMPNKVTMRLSQILGLSFLSMRFAAGQERKVRPAYARKTRNTQDYTPGTSQRLYALHHMSRRDVSRLL